MELILNSPLLDYLRLSWQNTEKGLDVAENFWLNLKLPNDYLYTVSNDLSAGIRKKMQYEGATIYQAHSLNGVSWLGEPVGFYGTAEQNGQKWYLLQTESHTDKFWVHSRDLFQSYPRLTRIDVQVTLDGGIPLRQFVNHHSVSGFIQDETLYINQRTNPRFYRIYHKPYDGGIATRFEIELKGAAAMAYKQEMFNSDNPALAVYSAEFDNMVSRLPPELAQIALERIKPILIESGTNEVRRKTTDHLSWIQKQVRPALLKYVRLDDLRNIVVDLAYEILETVDKIEKSG